MVVPGYDDTLMNDIKYHDVVEKGYWSLNLSGMKRGNEEFDVGNTLAVIDSGTSLIVGNQDLVN